MNGLNLNNWNLKCWKCPHTGPWKFGLAQALPDLIDHLPSLLSLEDPVEVPLQILGLHEPVDQLTVGYVTVRGEILLHLH